MKKAIRLIMLIMITTLFLAACDSAEDPPPAQAAQTTAPQAAQTTPPLAQTTPTPTIQPTPQAAPAHNTMRLRSPFPAIMQNGFFYIPRNALAYTMRMAGMEQLAGLEVIFYGRAYYNLADLNQLFGKNFHIDMQNLILVLR